jgi:hypothetical protein
VLTAFQQVNGAFYGPIDVGVEFCDSVVKARYVLHNYFRQKDGIRFMDAVHECALESIPPYGVLEKLSGINIRDCFASYFTSHKAQYNVSMEKCKVIAELVNS